MKTNKFVFASLALQVVMMDASAGYDIDKIEEYVNQFDSITVSTWAFLLKMNWIDSASLFKEILV